VLAHFFLARLELVDAPLLLGDRGARAWLLLLHLAFAPLATLAIAPVAVAAAAAFAAFAFALRT
jgi:hypothetical protein